MKIARIENIKSPALMIIQAGGQDNMRQIADAVTDLSQMVHRRIEPVIVVDKKEAPTARALYPKHYTVLGVSSKSDTQLHEELLPYEHRAIAIVCRGESNIPLFKKIIPHLPYVHAPTESSLDWTTDKILMRRRLAQYDKKITPKYTVVADASEESLAKIEKKVGFPLVVKPAGLASSLLVSICYHEEELAKTMRKTFRGIKKVYKQAKGRGEPKVLVEQFMEGAMYSLDAYVNARGTVYCLPLVHVKTGRSIGFDDFFGYQRLTPVKLKPHKIRKAYDTAERGIHALGLRSTTAHVELMKMEEGWKIIEIGPRIGGFRHKIYELSYGVNHTLNDILVRIPVRPKLYKKSKGYTAVLQLFSKKEGTLQSITGLKKLRSLHSFHSAAIKKKKGDRCYFAKHGGKSIADVTLFNKDRSKLLADIRRMEQNVKIVVVPLKKKRT